MIAEVLACASLIAAAVPGVLFFRNLKVYAPPPPASRESRPGVSLLIPARNEERNIQATLLAALASENVDLQIVVMDDQSTDGTRRLVEQIAKSDPRVSLESAPALPEGWCGKQHACDRLSGLARHPWLVFMDADVRLAPDALARMVRFMDEAKVSLGSGIPRQEVGTVSEQMLIPLIHFILLGFLPIRRMRAFSDPSYGAGCGQLFIARATDYRAAGGHAGIRQSLHDGVQLPRAFRRSGFKTDLFDATELATCRMYRSDAETWSGLGKNACEGLGSPWLIVPMTLILLLGQVVPFVLPVVEYGDWNWSVVLCFAAALIALAVRLTCAFRFGLPVVAALFHPVAVVMFLTIQWHALAMRVLGRPREWKSRQYAGSFGAGGS